MERIPSMRSVMTAFPHSIEANRPLSDALAMMEEHDIRHLPVVDNGQLVGVINDREIALALDPRLGIPAEEPPVRSACAMEAYVVGLSEPLDRVLVHMATKHVECALVAKDKKLVGIFTLTDACRRFADLLRTLFPSGGDEAA